MFGLRYFARGRFSIEPTKAMLLQRLADMLSKARTGCDDPGFAIDCKFRRPCQINLTRLQIRNRGFPKGGFREIDVWVVLVGHVLN